MRNASYENGNVLLEITRSFFDDGACFLTLGVLYSVAQRPSTAVINVVLCRNQRTIKSSEAYAFFLVNRKGKSSNKTRGMRCLTGGLSTAVEAAC